MIAPLLCIVIVCCEPPPEHVLDITTHAGDRGGGVAIRHKGKTYALTAAHVVASSYAETHTTYTNAAGEEWVETEYQWHRLQVKWRGQATKRNGAYGHVVWCDDANDLALIELETTQRPSPAALLLDAPVAGEDVWYCGPGANLPWNLQKSIVNSYDPKGHYYVNGGAWYGHSGSAAYVKRKGEWVVSGLISAPHDATNPRTPVRCVPIQTIRKFLKAYDQ